MKHIDNYSVILHKRDGEDYETIAILMTATKKNIKQVIVNCFLEWMYDENEETMKLLDRIVDSLYGDNHYIDEFDEFKMESAPYYE